MKLLRLARYVIAAMLLFTLSVVCIAQSTATKDQTIRVANQTIRYLSAGTEGSPIVLLHGWPQSADEFHKIIPTLAENHVVYAPDLSGIGGTTAPDQDWSKEALAGDIKRFVDALGLNKPLIVGHDIGGMVAYAYARRFSEELMGVAILDVPIPGLAPWDNVATSHHAWHFDFHNQIELAEHLVVGRQAEYFRYFINSTTPNPSAISDNDIALYAEAYGTNERLRAGFEFYRAFDEDAVFFQSHGGPFNVPMLIVGGEYSMGATLPIMAESYTRLGATDVTTVRIDNAGHWLAEEQPDATAAIITEYAGQLADR